MRSGFSYILCGRDSLGVLVEHEWKELINRQHFVQGFRPQELLGTIQREGITQCPVGVAWVHQAADSLHPVLWLLYLQPLTTYITTGRQLTT